MKLLNIDFTKKPKLLINGVEYSFNQNFSATDHIFNNAGSSLKLKDVYPIDYSDEDLMFKPFKIPKYSLGEIYFGDQLFYFGILKVQHKGSLNINKLKKISVVISSLKEFLVHEPMDFAVLKKKPEFVIDKIIQKLNIPYVVKGNISFTNNQIIKSYNTKDMTAYDALRYIERHTNSTLFINFNSENKNIEITYQSNDSVSKNSTGNVGVPIPFTSKDNISTFSKLYGIIDIDWEENSNSDVNTIRIESEKSVSNRSRIIEIDLSQNQTSITTPFPVGKIDRSNTKYLDSNGKEIRKLAISTQSQADKGRPSDITYTPNNNSLNINKRLITQNPAGSVVISYFPLIRQNIDFEDANDQKRVAERLKTEKGKLFRYEKYNDLTELDDIISQGQTLLEIGLANKLELRISSENVIWDLGQYVDFKGDKTYENFIGEYVVKDVAINFIVDSETGLQLGKFDYTLANLKQVESAFNYQDSQKYRDNPITDIENVAIDISETISEKIKLEALNLKMDCENLIEAKLDETLDLDLGIDEKENPWKDLAKYHILQV